MLRFLLAEVRKSERAELEAKARSLGIIPEPEDTDWDLLLAIEQREKLKLAVA